LPLDKLKNRYIIISPSVLEAKRAWLVYKISRLPKGEYQNNGGICFWTLL
jgi:hypothetical protein